MTTPSETRILLLRHAETSAPDRFHGCESDVGLSDRGLAQARQAATEIARVRPTALYCSALRRARETADAIAAVCGLPPRIAPELHERRMGPLSNTPREQSWAVYEEARRRWTAGELDHTHEGGESFAAVRDRVVPSLGAIADRHPGETVVVVAHGVVIRVLLCSLAAGLDPSRFADLPIDYVGIYALRRDETGWTLENDPPAERRTTDPSPW